MVMKRPKSDDWLGQELVAFVIAFGRSGQSVAFRQIAFKWKFDGGGNGDRFEG